MTRIELIGEIKKKRSFLCVGLDPSPLKIPSHLGSGVEAVIAFNKAIIDATHGYAVAYKPNTAFYESFGAEGWRVLAETIAYIPKECFVIADAKRGDIGNTAEQYAAAFFDRLGADSITLSPYMGKDSISPFLGRKGKWAIMLGVTSNPGAADLQFMQSKDNEALFERVIRKGVEWGNSEELMFVVGATRPELVAKVREIAPEHFFLVPGVGAQGGSLKDVMAAGMNEDVGILVNSSRGIIFASSGEDFADAASQQAHAIQQEMEAGLKAKALI